LGVAVKKPEQVKKKKWYLFPLVLLLAVLCVGGTELIVCSHFDPELYERVTAPVRDTVQAVTQAGQAVWGGLCQTADAATVRLRTAWDAFTAGPEPEPDEESQLVDNEAVTSPPRPRADYTITALESRDGQDVLTGGALDIVYYDQTDPLWAEEPYGTDKLGGYGCGPTAMSIVVSSLTDQGMDPAQMAQHCVKNGYWAKYHGSYLSIVPGVAEDLGLECVPLPPEEADADTVSQYLATGHLMVALMGPGHFTNGGHFIVLRGVTLEGGILIADPASPERSLTVWDLDLILAELSAKRSNGGPLWVISPRSA